MVPQSKREHGGWDVYGGVLMTLHPLGVRGGGGGAESQGGWVHRWQQATVGLGFLREEQQNLGSGAAPDVRLGRC